MRSVRASEILITETFGDPRQPQNLRTNHDANDDPEPFTATCSTMYIYISA